MEGEVIMANVVPVQFHGEQRAVAKPLSLGVRGAKATPEQECRIADALVCARGSLSQSQIALAAGVPQQHVSLWENPDDPRWPNLLHCERIAARYPAFAERLRAKLVTDDAVHVARDLCERFVSVMAEVGDVAREVNSAWADKRVDAAECAKVTREIDEAIEALQQLRRDVVEHAKEG